ncbi:MAG: DUF4403 family protein [Sphingobacteriales bacterium]|jgi:hypothetical protein
MRPEKLFPIILLILVAACSKKPIAEKPVIVNSSIALDTLPLSDIDIPIKINLKPFYAIAEKQVEKEYTTPNYPRDFVVENCDTRYMYRFRRGPLQFSTQGNQLQFGFTGFYIIAGGQRICSGTGSDRVSVTPWSPTCTCGLSEGERRVNVNFTAGMQITPSYHIVPTIKTNEPKPLDKCTVCFWGQDITQTIMDRLKAQLEDSRKSMQDTIMNMDLRPQFQKVWDILNAIQPVSNYGYLQINPQQLRVSNIRVEKDTLQLSVGISARPRVVQAKPAEVRTVIPDLTVGQNRRGFSIYTDALLNYDSLSNLLQASMYKKRIDAEGSSKYIIVEKVQVYGSNSAMLNLKMQFSGSVSGTFYLSGKPVYDAATKQLRLENLNYDIRSQSVVVKAGEWMFNKRILHELEKSTRFDVTAYEKMLLDKINAQFNKEVYKGVLMNGSVQNVSIEKIYPFVDQLVIRFSSKGDLEILVREISL